MAQPTTDGDLGGLLCVFAHPDDEAYLAGALMAVAADAGRRVVCVTATRGELGFPDDDPRSIEERAALRTAELDECLAILGVTEHVWLDHPDGGCADVPLDNPVGRLVEIIDEVRPDHVLTFGPDGQTYHPDHIATGRWTTLACDRAEHDTRLLYATMTPEWANAFGKHVDLAEVMMVPDVEVPTVEPDELSLWFVAEGDVLERKWQALRCQTSQTGGLIALMGVDAYRRFLVDEFFRDPRPADW